MILNLTQHKGTPDQGVTDLTGAELEELKSLLTFDELPTTQEIETRAHWIASLAASKKARFAMIGGAPYLMSALERALKRVGVKPVYAFSRRECVETTKNGETVKSMVFRHLGFVEAADRG